MQGKALTALATLLAALALAACGGGDDGSETSAGGAETSPTASPSQLRERADEVEKERKGKSESAGAGSKSSGGSGSGRAAAPDADPDPSAPVQHSDSGRGAAQFQRKGRDNSIQEFGQEGGGSEMARAAAVLHAYLDARASRDWEEACAHLSADVVASLEQFAATYAGDKQIDGCPDVLEVLAASTSASALRESAKADVGSLRMEGERGFLLYYGAGGEELAIPVTQEGGEWKLAAPEATPLP